MNYIELITNSLVTLVGRNNKDIINWEVMGTDADIINLDPIKISTVNPANGHIYYILPISNMDNALLFKQNTEAKYGITVNILTEEQAIQNKQLFLDSLPVK